MADALRDNNRVPTLIGVSNVDGTTPVLLKANPSTGGLIVEATIDTSAIATASNQTDGSQKTQIVDGSGNVIGATSNALDINIKSGNPTQITANAGTNLNTSLLALETGGNLATLAGAVSAGHLQVDVLSAPSTTVTATNLDIRDLASASDSVTAVQSVAANLNCTEASASAIKTAVELIDNSVDGNYLNVNMNVAGTDVAAGAGAVTAQTQRVTHASDDPVTTAVQLIDNAVSGAGFNITQFGGANVPIGAGLEATAIRVTLPTNGTGIVGLATGSNAIGKLAANSGVDIGDVTLNNLTTTPVYTQSNITGIAHGVTTVTTAGTDVALAASTPCKKVTIQAQTDNTGLIAVGASGVDATVATGTGIILDPGDVYEFEIDNLNDVYIDSTVSGEGVRYTYFT